MKFPDSSFNGLNVTIHVGTKSVTHGRTHAPKTICPTKVGGISKLVA